MLQEGDELYKGAKFEEAIVKYTQALDRITDKSSELALKAFSNRHVALSLLGQGPWMGRGRDVTDGRGAGAVCWVCRAACYKQLSNFDGVISDCTSVLEVKVRIQSRLLLVVSATL